MNDFRQEKPSALTIVLFAIYLLILSWLILFKLQFSVPVVEEGRVFNLIPILGSYRDNGVMLSGEIRNNIIAFVPLGIYICMLKSNWSFAKKMLVIIVFTLGYEITQFVFAIGRADMTDVISNTFGGIIGIGIYALLHKLLKGKTNKVLNIFAAIVTISIISIVAFLVANNRWIRIQ